MLSANWWDTNEDLSTGITNCELDVNQRTTIVAIQFGNNKKSLDNQGECLVDWGKPKVFEEVAWHTHNLLKRLKCESKMKTTEE